MSEREAEEPSAANADAVPAGQETGGGIVATVSVVVAAGAVVLGLVASGSGQPLLLTLLSVAAMLGVFFLFAFATGHVRIGKRSAAEELAGAVAAGFDDGVLIAARDGRAVYTNRRFKTMLGTGGAEGLGALEAGFGAEPEAAAALFRLVRAAERGEPRREEIALPGGLAGSRSTRYIRLAVRPFETPRRERETGPLAIWQLTDLTEDRAQAEQKLDVLEARLADYDRCPVGLLTAVDGSIEYVNHTFAAWLGLPAATIAGRGLKIADLLSTEGAELINRVKGQTALEPASVDLDLMRTDGQILPVRLFAEARSIDGRDDGIVIAAITRDEEDAFDFSDGPAEVRFARFFQSAPFGIATLAPDGAIVSANAAFARMILEGASGLNLPAGEVLGQAAEPEARAAVEAGLQQVLAGRGNVAPVEIASGPHKEYTRRVYMSPLARSGSAREAAILYVIDATEQKALEEKFAQSQKMEAVGKLAGGIAHDFNNVLTAIIGFSDLLLQTHRPSDPAYKDIMNIKSSANRAAGLVGKLLAFSRRQTLQTEVLQLGEVLTDLAPLLRRSLGESVELKVPTGRDLWYVKTDRTQIEHSIINLAVNARDAMPNGGTLTIRTRNVGERETQKLGHLGLAIGEYVLIEVEDDGTGMPPEVLAKIFEPFFTTKEVGKGTGLGLATVYGIVKQTGGYIFADSTPGKGTSFRLYLPRHHVESDEEFIAQKATKKEQRAVDLTGTGRVLVVEDEDIVRSFAVRALKRQGYEVLEAATGVEALEVMEQNEGRVDLVVSDVVMPEMDGPTLLKALRKKNAALKIIFVSGYPNDAFKESLGDDETFAFLPKPFSLPQLAAKVKEELGR